MNRVPHCAECERCQCIDFAYKDYYCCEEHDTMRIFGRLGVDHPPKTSPKWCPLRENIDSDLVKMESDIHLTDIKGNPIEVKSIQPEFLDRV